MHTDDQGIHRYSRIYLASTDISIAAVLELLHL
jgi:hypothetical protein